MSSYTFFLLDIASNNSPTLPVRALRNEEQQVRFIAKISNRAEVIAKDPGSVTPSSRNVIGEGKMIREIRDKHDDVANELNSNKRRRRDTFTMDEYSQDKQKVDEIVVSRNTSIDFKDSPSEISLRVKAMTMTAAAMREALIAAKPDKREEINKLKKFVSLDEPKDTPKLSTWMTRLLEGR